MFIALYFEIVTEIIDSDNNRLRSKIFIIKEEVDISRIFIVVFHILVWYIFFFVSHFIFQACDICLRKVEKLILRIPSFLYLFMHAWNQHSSWGFDVENGKYLLIAWKKHELFRADHIKMIYSFIKLEHSKYLIILFDMHDVEWLWVFVLFFYETNDIGIRRRDLKLVNSDSLKVPQWCCMC